MTTSLVYREVSAWHGSVDFTYRGKEVIIINRLQQYFYNTFMHNPDLQNLIIINNNKINEKYIIGQLIDINSTKLHLF